MIYYAATYCDNKGQTKKSVKDIREVNSFYYF